MGIERTPRKQVLVVAAPFGYGPAARALLVANGLAAVADSTILSSSDAYRFVERYKSEPVVCRHGGFRASFPHAASLAPFDLVVSLNNQPAVQHLIDIGLATRTVFVDSLLPWRAAHGPAATAAPVLAYLVQDFPGVEACMHACRAQRIERVAPMVWSAAQDGGHRRPRGGVTLHLGGVTSPLVSWDMLREPIEQILQRTHTLARRFGRRLSVIGSRHLAGIAPAGADDLTLLADISPSQTAALVADSELLLSTPGLGANFEALASGVPSILLPPMNSTQWMQYGVFTGMGLPGSMAQGAKAALQQTVAPMPWGQQTAACIAFLHRHLVASLAELPHHMGRLLSDETDVHRREVQRAGAAFMAGLSQNSAVAALREILLSSRPPTATRP